jgi:hypothetical protein
MVSEAAQRRRRNSARVNLVISVVFHAVAILGVTFLAARQGLLGTQFKEFAVTLAPKENQPEPEVEEEPAEAVKEDSAAAAGEELPPPAAPPDAPPPKMIREAPPVAAAGAPPPAAAVIPSFIFSDGAKAVSEDPVARYRGRIEYLLQSAWQRPSRIADPNLVTEVEVALDAEGRLAVKSYKKLSGDRAWDDSVRTVFERRIDVRGAPPPNFPDSFVVRFDVVEMASTL